VNREQIPEMNLTSPSQVRALLIEIGVHPSKSLGQNFLVDRNVLNILLETANLSRDDKVLEVGPGLGVVTEQLAGRVQHVAGVEKDKRLFDFLKKRFKDEAAVELICEDMLDINIDDLQGSRSTRGTTSTSSLLRRDYGGQAGQARVGHGTSERFRLNKVVSNFPYSVASRIVMNLARVDDPPSEIVGTLQQEVAERLAAQVGNWKYGILSVWSQLAYRVELVKSVRPTCFWPRPEVGSVIVKMTRHGVSLPPTRERTFFYEITKHAFMHRRKQLAAIFSRAPGHLNVPLDRARNVLDELGINTKARPENLTVKEWLDVIFRLTHGSQRY